MSKDIQLHECVRKICDAYAQDGKWRTMKELAEASGFTVATTRAHVKANPDLFERDEVMRTYPALRQFERAPTAKKVPVWRPTKGKDFNAG